MPGASMTVVVFLVLMAYLAQTSNVLINWINPNVSKNNFQYDMQFEPPFIPSDYQFDIAFGLGVPLDPSIGIY